MPSEEESVTMEEDQQEEEMEEEAKKYNQNENSAEETTPKYTLSKDIIADCISMPQRLGYGFSHAFVKLDCTDKNLTNIDILRQYIHLRFIILSNNFITDISPVSVIGHLLYLKADNNQIESVGCLSNTRFLQFLDLSNNRVKHINDLSIEYLQHLKLNENQISSLEGLYSNQFPGLHTLEVRGNSLSSLKGLSNVPHLLSFYCAENALTNFNDLGCMAALVRLHARDNNISDLSGLSAEMKSLEYLNLRNNKIRDYKTLRTIRDMPMLKVLSLVDNPITKRTDYRLKVISMFPNLLRLDKEKITPEERTRSKNFTEPFDDENDSSFGFEEHHNAEEEEEASEQDGEEEVSEND